ncbi:murein transglycosylase A [Yoonia vestfoldensis]|jgi:membrane-bound lytic murein transglycosylase A|uniref:peptidoglycan lytic exotransglycosylase n=1 Tax=Yoonia vestfoldensis TaxID=245188 RepID=A0A1Y0EGV0_9RHOB|nr:MltA domain-containing protein [Yoonia vestfoldensis]ARU02853.1 membrane-bound lytic murein transglycosylase A [Yoonia vestfoldensis]
MAKATYHIQRFDDLNGWAADEHRAALDVFCKTADRITDPWWQAACHLAPTSTDPRGFFEMYFRPVLISDGQPMLFTGYYEPEILGARVADDRFKYPVHALPPDLPKGATRRQIEQGQLAKGHELVWLSDPVDAFFLQVQGSGRIKLPDGSVLRLGFAAKNGLPYTSIGKELVARGVTSADQVSAAFIQSWVRQNPDAGRDLLWINESYVFFRILTDLADDDGPIGAMKRPVTAGRSIAVDPDHVPLGAPVWIEKDAPDPMTRLMVAQDTGSAIKGAQRADIFFGTGPGAGAIAGGVKHGGRMIVLLPIAVADRLAAGVI